MDAETDTRASRRHLELKRKGVNVPIDEVRMNLEVRDKIDTERDVSPLRKAEDAVTLDNSLITEQQQLEWALRLARERIA
jgi:cytidylate kinase